MDINKISFFFYSCPLSLLVNFALPGIKTDAELIQRGQTLSDPDPLQEDMEVLRRSSVFAAEVLDVFDRSLTEKDLVSQSKALCRDYILFRLNQNGLGWSKSELNLVPSNAALAEVSSVLLCLGKRKPQTSVKSSSF